MNTLTINYTVVESFEKLEESYQKLLLAAQEATHTAYAPYSHFYVGAALLLNDNSIITGSNQENMAYPSGLCAERTALFHYGSLKQKTAIKAIGVAARKEIEFLSCSPCGACRQVMYEYEMAQHAPIKVLFPSEDGKILIFESVKGILPFAFDF